MSMQVSLNDSDYENIEKWFEIVHAKHNEPKKSESITYYKLVTLHAQLLEDHANKDGDKNSRD